MLKRIGVGLLAIIICAICLEIGERFEIPGVHSFVGTAEAIIGRPLTPMSYAGRAEDRPTVCSGRLLLLGSSTAEGKGLHTL